MTVAATAMATASGAMLLSATASIAMISLTAIQTAILAGILAATVAALPLLTGILIFTVLDAVTPFANGGLVKGYADGGSIGSEGSGGGGLRAFQQAHNIPSSDTVPAMLTPGEFVLKPDAVKKYGIPFLNALNGSLVDPRALLGMPTTSGIMKSSGAGVLSFNTGGVVPGGASNAKASRLDTAASGETGGIQPLPVMVATNAEAEKLFTGGSTAFEDRMNKTTLTGDRNKSKEWK